jgi:hypothetical protein
VTSKSSSQSVNKKESEISAAIEKAKEDLKAAEELKKDTITHLAAKLERLGVKKFKISSRIKRELVPEGYVTAKYIEMCLHPSQKQTEKAKKKVTISNTGEEVFEYEGTESGAHIASDNDEVVRHMSTKTSKTDTVSDISPDERDEEIERLRIEVENLKSDFKREHELLVEARAHQMAPAPIGYRYLLVKIPELKAESTFHLKDRSDYNQLQQIVIEKPYDIAALRRAFFDKRIEIIGIEVYCANDKFIKTRVSARRAV